jgi:hypothetical protein
MKLFLNNYVTKILFFLLLTSLEIFPISRSAIQIGRLKIRGDAVIKLAFNQYEFNKNKSILIDIGNERIPTQIIETRGKSENEIKNEVTRVVSKRLGKIYGLSEEEQEELDDQLNVSKQQFINASIENTNRCSSEYRFNAIRNSTIRDIKGGNRQRAWVEVEQEVNQMIDEYVKAYDPSNIIDTQEKLNSFVVTFINCNHPDYETRINARMGLWYMPYLKSHIFGDKIQNAAKSLISRYFKKNKLIDISYDKRLAETMECFISKDTYHHWRDQKYKRVFDLIKEEKLDYGDSFARLERKINDQLSKEDKKRKKEYKVKTRCCRGNKPKKIYDDPYNKALRDVAALCKEGLFENAHTIMKRFKSPEEIQLKMAILNYYKEKWCNYFGILKKYEFLPLWQKLPYEQKRVIAESIVLQNKMNRQLQEEAVKLQTEDALQTEAELKIAREREQEIELGTEVSFNQMEQADQLRNLYSSCITARLKAFEQSSNTNFQRSLRYTNWPSMPSDFKAKFELDNLATSIEGTPTQHAVQQEFRIIAQETARVWKVHGNNSHVEDLVKKNVTCIKKGVAQNEKGNIAEAAQFADIAWTVLDHALAVGEGMAEGTINVAYTFSHPVETAKNIGQLAYTITSLVGNATLEAIDLCILGVTDKPAAQEKLKTWEQNFTHLIDTAYQQYQETPSRDITKFISTFATETFLTGKTCHALKGFFSFARTKTTKLIQKAQNITEAPVFATTSEGITAQVNKAVKQAENVTKVTKNVKRATEKIIKKSIDIVNQTSEAVLKNGYYEVNGFKFTEFYYNKLWQNGRGAPSLAAKAILENTIKIVPDPAGYPGFFKYFSDKWEMVYNPTTKIVSHIQPIRNRRI